MLSNTCIKYTGALARQKTISLGKHPFLTIVTILLRSPRLIPRIQVFSKNKMLSLTLLVSTVKAKSGLAIASL